MKIVASSLLLVTFLVDPLKIFRNPTTNFLIGLAIVDLLTALIQESISATCFMLMYFQHTSWTKCALGRNESLWNKERFPLNSPSPTWHGIIFSWLELPRNATMTVVCLSNLQINVLPSSNWRHGKTKALKLNSKISISKTIRFDS